MPTLFEIAFDRSLSVIKFIKPSFPSNAFSFYVQYFFLLNFSPLYVYDLVYILFDQLTFLCYPEITFFWKILENRETIDITVAQTA